MQQNFSNKTRALADVVSLEAWHDPFGVISSKVNLYADVVFRDGRLGGESSSKVRFHLSIKRAELIVIIPESEPIEIDPSSVSRDSPEIFVKKMQQMHEQIEGGGQLSLNLGNSEKSRSQASAQFGGSMSLEKSTETTQNVTGIQVLQSQTADGHYRWELTPTIEKALKGRPWDANSSPRLKLSDRRPDRSKGIPPIVTIQIKCLREDLLITDIELKQSDFWEKFSTSLNFRNKQIAAEAYIRDRLVSEGLEFGNLNDSYTPIVLARTCTSSEG